MLLQRNTALSVTDAINSRVAHGKVKSSFPHRFEGEGSIGNDVEKKLFLNSILSTIIVKSEMEWLKSIFRLYFIFFVLSFSVFVIESSPSRLCNFQPTMK